MIVSEGDRWVYLGIPKTASTALHEFFETRGAQPVGRQHDMHVPEAWRDWLVFASTLNPYRRAWSLWRMLAGDVAKGAPWTHGIEPEATRTFAAYVERVLFRHEPRLAVFQRTMCDWVAQVPAGTRVHLVPAEDLGPGLRGLGLLRRGERVPIRNTTKGSPLDDYDPFTAEAVRRWAAEDFEAFGYSERLADAGSPPRRRRGPGLPGRLFAAPPVVLEGRARPSSPGARQGLV